MSEQERLQELAHFLKDRRARIRPADAGLPPTSRRRVRGLRREEVASLAGIGVSWYTALENGSANHVSEATLLAIADVLRLSESERHYIMALAEPSGGPDNEVPGPLLVETMNALTVPAYIITASWMVPHCNAAFRRVWSVGDDETPFNAIERLFLHPVTREMHGKHFVENITPVIAMLRSGLGRRPSFESLRRLRDRLLAHAAIEEIWNDYEITSPWTPTSFNIESSIGTFNYQTLDLPIPGAIHGLVVQVPDKPSRERLENAT
jgi:transcriptional regulator with XRE-family HTH domain